MSKFKNKPKGKFRSRTEAFVDGLLKRLKRKHKFKYEYETDSIEYTVTRKYIPDFVIQTKESCFYIEVKGYFPKEQRAKMLAIIKSNPHVPLYLFFPKDGKLYRKGKMKYSDWCELNNIPYAIGELPEEWFKE